jgi:hypothetical protein
MYSTDAASLRVLNYICISADNKSASASVLVGHDISAAFDTLCYSVLLCRLKVA